MKQELWLGDCLELMKNIPDKSVDMVCCDLPFGKTNIGWDCCIDFVGLWDSYKRITKVGSAIVLFGSGIFTAKLILSCEKFYKYNLVWKKSKCGSPLLAKYRPMAKHEDIVVFSNGGGRHMVYNPQMEKGKPYSRNNVGIKLNNHGYGLKQVTTKNEGTRHPSSILDFPQKWRRQDQIHPTQKPIELCEYLIKMYTNEGDIVLDNCFGSGSSLIACKNLNRNFIGIEKEEKYYNIAKERLGL
jgi:DNA modification methylase